MSDNIVWLVDMEATEIQADPFATKVRDWLVAQKIIVPTIAPEPSFGGGDVFPPGPNAVEWARGHEIRTLSLCGLEIVKERTVFHTGGNGIDALQCPSCGQRHDVDEIAWSPPVENWFAQEGSDVLICPGCQTPASITEWHFRNMEWGFGYLGFGFWNWAISENLIREIGDLLGHRYRVVYEHI